MNQNDIKIKTLMKKIEEQEKALGPKPKAQYITNCVFGGINLHVCGTSEIIKLMGEMINARKMANEACEVLGIPNPDPEGKMCGYSSGYPYDDCVHDFKMRLSILEWNAKNNKIQKTRNLLDSLISQDTKTADILEGLEKELK